MFTKKLSVLLFVFPLFFSCKKDKLKNEYNAFEGSWRLEKITRTTNSDYPPYQTIDTIFSLDISNDYLLKFIYKGELIQEKNGVEMRKDRIVFNAFNDFNYGGYPSSCKQFQIFLNNDKEDKLSGLLFNDTIKLGAHELTKEEYPPLFGEEQVTHQFFYVKCN